MKILSVCILLVLAGAAHAQATPALPPQPAPAPAPRFVTEIAIGGETSMIKGQPFSAEAVSETVQTLADGNRIVRKWSNKLYRDGQGRFRREGANGAGSVLGAYLSGDSSVTVIDPAGSRFYIDQNARTARIITMPNGVMKLNGQNAIVLNGAPTAEKIQAELKAKGVTGVTVVQGDKPGTVYVPGGEPAKAATVERLATMAAGQAMVYGTATASTTKYDVRSENLGTQNFEGVDAEGTRTTTTIPAEAIGNERPIEIVYERWYSKELGMIVYSKHSDPRFGEQTYRLTNINRSEPDPSLFEVPAGYKVVSEPTTIFRSTAPRPVSERVAPARVYTSASGTKP